MKPARIELHIDELVLHGFAAGDRHAIRDAVQLELTRLFAEQGLDASRLGRGDRVDVNAGEFQVARESRPQAVGAQVAQAVHRGVTR